LKFFLWNVNFIYSFSKLYEYYLYLCLNTKEMVKINSWEEFLSYPKSKWGYPEPSGMTEDSIGLYKSHKQY